MSDNVTETGYATDINGRSKVRVAQRSSEFYIYDRDKETVFSLKNDSIPGIREIPAYFKDYPAVYEKMKKGQ